MSSTWQVRFTNAFTRFLNGKAGRDSPGFWSDAMEKWTELGIDWRLDPDLWTLSWESPNLLDHRLGWIAPILFVGVSWSSSLMNQIVQIQTLGWCSDALGKTFRDVTTFGDVCGLSPQRFQPGGIEHVLNDQGSPVLGFSEPLSDLALMIDGKSGYVEQ